MRHLTTTAALVLASAISAAAQTPITAGTLQIATKEVGEVDTG